MVDVLLPRSAAELFDLLDRTEDHRLLAGGTDLLVWHRESPLPARAFIGLERVPELTGIRIDDGEIVLGAATTFRRLAESPIVRQHLDVLCQAIRLLGSPAILHAATLGGNICTASPAADSLPPLYVLGARVELRSPHGRRLLDVADFVTGPRQTALAPGEVLWSVRVPVPDARLRGAFFKVGQRKALAIAVVSLAAAWNEDEERAVRAVRLAWGSVGPTVLRFPDIERVLEGKPLTADTLRPAAEEATRRVRPIDDVRASASYRRRVAGNLLYRLANP
jgi:CO/xanthine dehydrogenase FAD-binding subunit